jgi:hypothetical protein
MGQGVIPRRLLEVRLISLPKTGKVKTPSFKDQLSSREIQALGSLVKTLR